MVVGWLARMVVVAMLGGASAQANGAEDQPDQGGQRPPSSPMGGDAPLKRYSGEVLAFDKWENALDLKATSMFNRKASDLASPTVLLTAEWNYRFRSDFYLGLALSGAPQKATVATSDNSNKEYTTYYGGLNLGQALMQSGAHRLVAQVSGGVGVVYVRSTPYGSVDSSIDKPQYTYVEPGIFYTFYEYAALDLGVVLTYRYARLIAKSAVVSSEPIVTNANLSSMTFGVTFRSRHH